MNTETIERIFQPLKEKALADLAALVDIGSFTEDPNGLGKAGDKIIECAANNGLKLEKVPAGGIAKGAFHLAGDDANGDGFIGIIGHFDTVHPPSSPFRRMIDKGETITGPGVADMKSGIIAAIYGLRIAEEALGRERLPVKIVFNCDEERGSIDSRPLIESMMKGARGALIFEGKKVSDNALVTSRKAVLMGEMMVTGKEAHAGEAPWEGADAIVEAAHKIIALNALNDFEKGVVVTTGRIAGGKVPNQIPAHCSSSIDIRVRTPEQEVQVRKAVKEIMEKKHITGCTTEYTLETARPSFLKNAESEELRVLYTKAAAAFGINVPEREGGGGSDGNITSAIGVPTIDGLGPAGDFSHTDREYINKASFFDTIKVFALFLIQILND